MIDIFVASCFATSNCILNIKCVLIGYYCAVPCSNVLFIVDMQITSRWNLVSFQVRTWCEVAQYM